MTSAKQAAGSSTGLDPEHVELERVRVLEGERGVTHLCYRVRRAA
jgi:hypothetical protein